jgi:hypothetical protein
VREKKAVDTEAAPSSIARSLAPTASANGADGTDKGDTTDRVIGSSNNGGDEVGLP